MIELTPFFFMIAVPAIVFAGISKGGFGSGASFAATPILAMILDPGAALVMMLPLLMMMDVASLKAYWRQWDTGVAKVLVIGSFPGVLLGFLLYNVTHPDVLRFLIGFVAVAFVIYRLSMTANLIKTPKSEPGPVVGYFAGAVAGFTSFVSHAGGPPVAVYMLGKNLGKTEFQATTVIVFWLINIAKFIPLALSGAFDRSVVLADLILAPFAVFGVWIGVIAHRHMPERLFFGLTYVLLLITGGKLIWTALT